MRAIASLTLVLPALLAADEPRGQSGGAADRAEAFTPSGPAPAPVLMKPGEDRKDAVHCGLAWLTRHQDPDGFWSTRTFDRQCGTEKCVGEGERGNNVGVTGLCVLAYLGAGFTHREKGTVKDPSTGRDLNHGAAVKKALEWLVRRQEHDGLLASRNGARMMYHHAIATLALCEAYRLTESELFEEPAQMAVDYLEAAQNPGKGWRYTPRCGDNDSSVTGWAVLALGSARAAGLDLPKQSLKDAIAWFDEVTDETYGRVGYTAKGTGKVITVGRNEEWDHHETLTGLAMTCRLIAGKSRRDLNVEMAARLLVADLPVWADKKVDTYYWFHGTLALGHFDARDGKYWRSWAKAVTFALTENQRKKGCDAGSWDVAPDRWAFEGGRAYTTAMGVLTLEMAEGYGEKLIGQR